MGFLKHLFKLWLIAIFINLIMAFIIEKASDSQKHIGLKHTTNQKMHLVDSSVDLVNENIENKNSNVKTNDLYPNDEYYYDSLNEEGQINKNQNVYVYTSTPINIREDYKQILKEYKEILEFNRKNTKSLSNTSNLEDTESYDYEDVNKIETIEDYFHDLFESHDDNLPHSQGESQQNMQANLKEKTNKKEVNKTTHPNYRTNQSTQAGHIKPVSSNKKMIIDKTNSHNKEEKAVEHSNLIIIIGCSILLIIFVLFVAAFVFIVKRSKKNLKNKSLTNKTDTANSYQANYTTVNQNEV
jgi:hypothetical protein